MTRPVAGGPSCPDVRSRSSSCARGKGASGSSATRTGSTNCIPAIRSPARSGRRLRSGTAAANSSGMRPGTRCAIPCSRPEDGVSIPRRYPPWLRRRAAGTRSGGIQSQKSCPPRSGRWKRNAWAPPGTVWDGVWRTPVRRKSSFPNRSRTARRPTCCVSTPGRRCTSIMTQFPT